MSQKEEIEKEVPSEKQMAIRAEEPVVEYLNTIETQQGTDIAVYSSQSRKYLIFYLIDIDQVLRWQGVTRGALSLTHKKLLKSFILGRKDEYPRVEALSWGSYRVSGCEIELSFKEVF